MLIQAVIFVSGIASALKACPGNSAPYRGSLQLGIHSFINGEMFLPYFTIINYKNSCYLQAEQASFGTFLKMAITDGYYFTIKEKTTIDPNTGISSTEGDYAVLYFKNFQAGGTNAGTPDDNIHMGPIYPIPGTPPMEDPTQIRDAFGKLGEYAG
jgi:hypothetical protein